MVWVNSGDRMATSGRSSSWESGILRCTAVSCSTAAPVHSDPVPLVVGTAARIAFLRSPSLSRGETMHTFLMSGRSYRIQATLALSMTDPPPTARIRSGSNAFIASPHCSTLSMGASGRHFGQVSQVNPPFSRKGVIFFTKRWLN
jgi:hypothetical protein